MAGFLAGATLTAASSRGGTVIVDHDGAIDDYVALLMVLRSTERRLAGVTISFGNSHREEAREATERILAAYDRAVPVGVHADNLRGKNQFPPEWRRSANGVQQLFGRPARPLASADATDLLRRLLSSAGPGGVEVLATGPLSNLAAAVRGRETLIRRMNRLVVMGGAVGVPGNAPGGVAEYNFHVDPEAADYVCSLARRGLRIELVPLDATNHLPIGRPFVERLLSLPEGPGRQAGQLLSLAKTALDPGEAYYLWDAAAALVLLRSDLFTYETLHLKVTPEGGTVVARDGRGPIRVAMRPRSGVRAVEEVVTLLK